MGFVLFVGAFISLGVAEERQQVVISATPARIQIATSTQAATESQEATPTWTPSPTPRGVILLEAISEANVRAAPDIDSERLGAIQAGETYPILGRSFRWIQFRYDPSPNGTGWVFEELVNIIGNPADIIDLNANTLPQVDPSVVAATQTWAAITLVPGGVLTVTAESRIIQAPVAAPSLASELPDNVDNGPLPTFTYPPNIIAEAPSEIGSAQIAATVDTLVDESAGQVAPIAPILILGGIGLLGLLISSIRR